MEKRTLPKHLSYFVVGFTEVFRLRKGDCDILAWGLATHTLVFVFMTNRYLSYIVSTAASCQI